MDEKTALEFLHVAFDLADEYSKPESALGFHWSSDPEEQQRDIESLTYILTSSQAPPKTKDWAYDKISELAKEYWKSGDLDDMPRALALWSSGVTSGEVSRPKRGRGVIGLIMSRAITRLSRWSAGSAKKARKRSVQSSWLPRLLNSG